jgi:hypothetical protein
MFLEELGPCQLKQISADQVEAQMGQWAYLNSDAYIKESLAEYDRMMRHQDPLRGRWFQVYDNAKYSKMPDDDARALADSIWVSDLVAVTCLTRGLGIGDPATGRIYQGRDQAIELSLAVGQLGLLGVSMLGGGCAGRAGMELAGDFGRGVSCEQVMVEVAARRAAQEAAELAASQAGRGGILGAPVRAMPKTGAYGALAQELSGSGLQASHLNQNAAFRAVIPQEEGIAVGMRGNTFTAVGSPHYEFHSSLERFWN